MLIDILHVEDSPIVVRGFKSLLDNLIKEEFHREYSYKDFSNLKDFEEYMTQGNTAQIYFVDGTFKRTPEARGTEFLFPEAVKIIRVHDVSPKIWLLSLESQGARLAQECQTGFIDKGSRESFNDIKDVLTQVGLIPKGVGY